MTSDSRSSTPQRTPVQQVDDILAQNARIAEGWMSQSDAEQLADKIEAAVKRPSGRGTDYVRLDEPSWDLILAALRAAPPTTKPSSDARAVAEVLKWLDAQDAYLEKLSRESQLPTMPARAAALIRSAYAATLGKEKP